jgi:flagella basal body P-ring formation protein FlgA
MDPSTALENEPPASLAVSPDLAGGGPAPEPDVVAQGAASVGEAPSLEASSTWTLRAHAEAQGARVYLRDVADCAGNVDLCTEAESVDLGAAPAPGDTHLIAASRLVATLQHEFPRRVPSNIGLKGARAVRVVAAATSLSSADLESALRERLARLVTPDASFAVTLVRAKAAQTVKLRPGEVVIDFPVLTAEALASFEWVTKNLNGTKRLTAIVRRTDSGEGEADVALTALFAVKVRAPVATHDLPRDERVTSVDLAVEWVDIGRSGVRFALRADELIGRVLTRPVAMGETVPLGAVTKELVVHRGQLMRLVLRGSGLEIASTAKALASGAVGDTIEVQQATTKKHLSARIVDGNTVVSQR